MKYLLSSVSGSTSKFKTVRESILLMKTLRLSATFAFMLLCACVTQAQTQTPPARVAEIQAALRDNKLDGWLFYDFRKSDPLAYRILKLDEKGITTRRWFFYVPARHRRRAA